MVNYACDPKARRQRTEHYICSHNCDSICHKNVSHRSSKQSDYQSCWSSCKVSLGRCSIQSSALHACKPRMVISFATFKFIYKIRGDANLHIISHDYFASDVIALSSLHTGSKIFLSDLTNISIVLECTKIQTYDVHKETVLFQVGHSCELNYVKQCYY